MSREKHNTLNICEILEKCVRTFSFAVIGLLNQETPLRLLFFFIVFPMRRFFQIGFLKSLTPILKRGSLMKQLQSMATLRKETLFTGKCSRLLYSTVLSFFSYNPRINAVFFLLRAALFRGRRLLEILLPSAVFNRVNTVLVPSSGFCLLPIMWKDWRYVRRIEIGPLQLGSSDQTVTKMFLFRFLRNKIINFTVYEHVLRIAWYM